VKVRLPEELHVRQADLMVRLASRFSAKVVLRLEGRAEPADARSIVDVVALAAVRGDEMEIEADGDDAEAAVRAIVELVERGFDADLVPQLATGMVEGIGAGRAMMIGDVEAPSPRSVRTIEQAIAFAIREVDVLIAALPADAAVLFAPERPILEELGARVAARIALGEAVEDAVIEETASNVSDLLLDARARILDALRGGDDAAARRTLEAAVALGEPVVAVVTRPLTPSLVAELPANVTAIVAGEGAGGGTSHAAILARGRDLPLVRVPGHVLASIAEGVPVVVDTTGEPARVWVNPSTALVTEARARRAARTRALTEGGEASIEHLAVALRANVGSLYDEVPAGARGVGLLRTEIAFAGRVNAPSVVEQVAMIAAVARKTGSEPLVVRLFDAGGDKPLAWLRPPSDSPEARGIALLLAHPVVLGGQLHAIERVRASLGAHADVRVLIPLVRSERDVDEVRARAPKGLLIGAMIETPDAALAIAAIAERADFVSIGTNDLAAEALGTSREAAGLALHRTVLALVRSVINGTHARGRTVTVCGEIAGDPRGARILVGLGVDALSMAPTRVFDVRRSLAAVTIDECRALAREALGE
jgi:phosphotransferase system HPr (HPr) family protein